MTLLSVDGKRQMKPMSGRYQLIPCTRPRRPRTDHRAGTEALPFRPRKLIGSQGTLGGTVGQVKANIDRHRLHRFVELHHAFHFVMNLAGVRRDRQRSVFVKATDRLHEENRFGHRFIAEFNGMLGKGSDGAPHGHGTPRFQPFMNTALPKDDSLLAHPLTMATEWSVRKRRPVRRKHIAPLLKRLESDLAIDLNVDGAFLEMAEYGPWTMVFVDRTPQVIELLDDQDQRCVFLTLRGFLEHMDALKWVEVDHGAIPFLMNGADCMVAGVHGAETSVKAGDLVWIRDMTHKRPLALGWAVDDGEVMVESTKGKGIKTVHWVGDELWDME